MTDTEETEAGAPEEAAADVPNDTPPDKEEEEETFSPVQFIGNFFNKHWQFYLGLILFFVIVYFGGGFQEYQAYLAEVHGAKKEAKDAEKKAALFESRVAAKLNRTETEASKIEHDSKARMTAAKALHEEAHKKERAAEAAAAAAKEEVNLAHAAEEKAIANATAAEDSVKHHAEYYDWKLKEAQRMKDEAADSEHHAEEEVQQATEIKREADLEKEHPAQWAQKQVEKARAADVADVRAAQAATQKAQDDLAKQQSNSVEEVKNAQGAALQSQAKEAKSSSLMEVWQIAALVGWILVLILVCFGYNYGPSDRSHQPAGSDDLRESLLEAGREVREMKKDLEYEQLMLQTRNTSSLQDRDKITEEVTEKIKRMEAMLAKLQ